MTTSDEHDKTRIKTTEQPATGGDDKTRYKPTPSNEASSRAAPAHIARPDAVSPKPTIQSREADKRQLDRTQIKPSNNPGAPSNRDAANPDKTQVLLKKSSTDVNPPQDKTHFTRPIQKPATPNPTSPNPASQNVSARTDSTQIGDRAPKNTALKSDYGVLKNRFIFEEVLGAGGMGVVYKAKDLLKIEAQDREPYVAIKVLSDEFKAHPEAFIALQRESRKTQKIAHPNIVTVYDFDRDGDTVFMTMEYMEGKPLDKLINQYRSVGLPIEDVHKILEGISAALMYAHAQDIIHSDFKPGNIFVSNKGIAKVFDFGIARAVAKAEHREESYDDRTVFDAGNLGALTPAYASLEMLEGEAPDVRDDIYALGCIAYELFTGEHPYNRMHADEAQRQKVKLAKIPNLTKNQWRAIERALAFKREDRTESVEAFWEEFTKKKTHTLKVIFASLLILGAAVGAAYYYMPEQAPTLSEDEVRNQIEQKLRIELKMKSLEDLLRVTDVNSGWEAQVWADVQELRQLLGTKDTWLQQKERDIYGLYVAAIEHNIKNENFKVALSLVENAHRYTTDTAQLQSFSMLIAQAIIDQKKAQEALLLQQQMAEQEQAVAQKAAAQKAATASQIHSAYETALASVNKQLECRTNLDMKDFEIAITKLRSLNEGRYVKEEPTITTSLARCIERIGNSFPERAGEAKKHALRIFKGNATIIAITIATKDPCSTSIAGLGARGLGSSCKDKLTGASKAPVMVVVPKKGSINAFAIGKFEITVDELNEFCKQTGSCRANTAVDASLPATNVSASTINAYLKWLSEKADRKYRLPSLVEWQYAAKATAARIDPNRNCKLNSRGIQKGGNLIKASIGQQNAWGVVNYLGNAQELVTDRGDKYFAAGGSFETEMQECGFNKQAMHTGAADNMTGFRVLRELQN